MSLGAALAAVLTHDPGVRSLVSGRVFRERLPKDFKLPAVKFQELWREDDEVLSGPVKTARTMVQVSAIAADAETCDRLEEAIRQALRGAPGTAAGVALHSVVLGRLTIAPWRANVPLDDRGIFERIREFSIRHAVEPVSR